MLLVFLSKLSAQLLCLLLQFVTGVLKKPFFNLLGIFNLKSIKRSEDLWLDKVKNWPELAQIVLEGSSRQDYTVALDFEPGHVSPELSVSVLSFVSLINYDDVIPNIWQILRLRGDHAVAGYKNPAFPPQRFHLLVTTVFFLVVELHDASALAPLAQFFLPVSFHRCWHHHEHLFYHFCIEESLQIGCHLNRLSQTHIVPQNSTLAAVPKFVKPLDTKFLVVKKAIISVLR